MLNKFLQLSALGVCATTLVGCASIVSGSSKTMTVNTGEDRGAICTLRNERGTWTTSPKSSSATVLRSTSDMTIECEKDGKTGCRTVTSSLEGWFLGNLLFGGIIGAPIDLGTGAAFDYPDTVDVKLD